MYFLSDKGRRIRFITPHHAFHHTYLLSASVHCFKTPYKAGYWGSSHRPVILHDMSVPLPTLLALMRGGAGPPTSILPPMELNGTVTGMMTSLERSSSSEDDNDELNDQERKGKSLSSPNKSQQTQRLILRQRSTTSRVLFALTQQDSAHSSLAGDST